MLTKKEQIGHQLVKVDIDRMILVNVNIHDIGLVNNNNNLDSQEYILITIKII